MRLQFSGRPSDVLPVGTTAKPDPEQGAIAILMAVVTTVVLGFAAFGFDLAYVRYARLQLQNATDAAAHAALVRLRASGNTGQATGTAISVAVQNRVWGKPLTLQPADFVFGGWDFTTGLFKANVSPPNAVQVTGTRSALKGANGAIGLSFGRVLGQSTVSLAHVGVAAYRIRSVVVAEDVTGSLWSAVDPAGDADVALLDAMHAFNIPADRIGMQLFTGAAVQFTALTNLQTGYATVRNQWQGDGKPFDDATKTSGISLCNKLDTGPASTLHPAYRHAWMPPCSNGGDGTNQGAALKAATAQLLAQSQPYETRVIVLVTDGKPECCTTSGSTVTCDGGASACAQKRAQDGLDMADAAEAQGIDIFTVSLGSDPQQTAYNASLVRGIGVAYDTPDPAELSTIMTTIAGKVPVALVR